MNESFLLWAIARSCGSGRKQLADSWNHVCTAWVSLTKESSQAWLCSLLPNHPRSQAMCDTPKL